MAIVIVALVVFAAGAVAGAMLLVSWGRQREERDFIQTAQARLGADPALVRAVARCV